MGNSCCLAQDVDLPLWFFFFKCTFSCLCALHPRLGLRRERWVCNISYSFPEESEHISHIFYFYYSTQRTTLIGGYNHLCSVFYHRDPTHGLNKLLYLMRLIDCGCGAFRKVCPHEVRNGLAGCVFILLSNLSGRKYLS